MKESNHPYRTPADKAPEPKPRISLRPQLWLASFIFSLLLLAVAAGIFPNNSFSILYIYIMKWAFVIGISAALLAGAIIVIWFISCGIISAILKIEFTDLLTCKPIKDCRRIPDNETNNSGY